MRRAVGLVALTILTFSGLASLRASAGQRSIHVFYRYPATGDVAGVALYYGASRSDVERNVNLTRVDLRLRGANADGVATVSIPFFDDTRDYFVTLRSYDSAGRESPNSGIALVAASAPPPGAIFAESFESYVAGADPAGWVDSGSGVAAAGSASLFAVSAQSNGSMALAAISSATDLNSTLVVSGSSGWSTYEFTGRVESDWSEGETGVSVLSAYPDAQFYYRLSHAGTAAWKLSKRGGTGTLTCAPSSSTGVGSGAGSWFRFRVRATRFDGRNRVRASVWADGTSAPAGFQVDCWDTDLESNASGRIGVYSSGAARSHWDDLAVVNVAADGAPPGYGNAPPAAPAPPPPPPSVPRAPLPPPPPPPPANDGYTSESALLHWWRPGWDMNDLGHDFAKVADVDAFEDQKGVAASDIELGGSSNASVDLDGKAEALGNYDLHPYGIGDTWSIAAWVRPERLSVTSQSRYVLDLNGKMSTDSVSRISLSIDSGGHFAVEVSDSLGRARQISAPAGLLLTDAGDTWYHVAAVKTKTSSLALYVNGVQVAATSVGVPSQDNAPRALRIGGLVKTSQGRFWQGGIASVAVWNTALRAPEVSALFAKGNRSVEIRSALPLH